MLTNSKRKLRACVESDFEVKDSTIAGIGKGLFALSNIQEGDSIGPYTGILVNDEECGSEPYANSHYILWVCKDTHIVAEGESASYTRYINHSDDPNAKFVVSTRWKKARVEAVKLIGRGEEIFIDYGPYFWDVTDAPKPNS